MEINELCDDPNCECRNEIIAGNARQIKNELCEVLEKHGVRNYIFSYDMGSAHAVGMNGDRMEVIRLITSMIDTVVE